jgi:alcohol dehydrogenase class IV
MPTVPLSATIAFPTRYLIGAGRRAELAREAAALGMKRALLVTDAGVAALPWFEPMAAAAREAGLWLTSFDGIRSNPVEANVREGVESFRAGGCDGVVMVGGGSVMDAGKAIALLSGHDGAALDYEFRGKKTRPIEAGKVAPMIALPTTAGSGSELSGGALVTATRARGQRPRLHPALLPGCVIADPETTLALPARLTAATGMDALTHALEAYCVPGYNPMCDAIALEALRLIRVYLPVVHRRPDDLEARTQVMMAASMAAVAFSKGLGLCHAMAHPLGAVTDIHHGLANGILLPHVLEHNRVSVAAIMPRLARILALYGHGFDAVHEWLLELRAELGIPHTLAEAGVARDGLIAELAPRAMNERIYLATNPAPVTEADIEAIYRRAGAEA